MNAIIEKLLQPVSSEQPCGPDLSNDPRYDELETILKGKPEVEVGAVKKPAEPPDWKNLKDKSAEFLAKSRHLRVATMLCCGLLKTDGLSGFRDGLQLVRGLLEQYWSTLYPLLDPADNNDPTQRLNILGAFNVPRGSPVFTGWLAISNHLYVAPLCQPPGAPAVTLDLVQAGKRKDPVPEGEEASVPQTRNVAALIQAADRTQMASQYQTLQQALEAIQGIDQFLTKSLGAGNTISFEILEQVLKEMMAVLQPYLPGAATGGATQAGGDATNSDAGVFSVSGSIRSREQVVQALDSICQYYRQVEPSSPVPFLLRRAQKLALMDFVQAMEELKLATPDSLRPSMGSAVDDASDKK